MKIVIRKHSEFRKNVSFMLVMYWAILVVWQNIGGSQARSSIDVIIKIGLLVYFMIFFIKTSRKVYKKIILVMCFAIVLFITFLNEINISLNTIIFYIYPILFTTMIYGIGDRYTVNKEQLLKYYNCIIVITLYAAIYAVIFCREQFTGISTVNNAYGNELSSFFVSSHEYGMYLVSASIACLVCLKYVNNKKSSMFYIVSLSIFLPNLVLTFSRTSIFAMVIFLIIYSMFDKGNLKKYILVFTAIVILIIIINPDIRVFIYEIVLKGNSLGSREELFEGAVEYYKNGTIMEKLFGFGINRPRQYFSDSFGHGSIHNAYLQVLLYFGASGLIALLLFLSSQIASCLKLIRKDRFMGSIMLAILFMAIGIMFTNTSTMFMSSIDSYFLTVFSVVIPKYVKNSIQYEL